MEHERTSAVQNCTKTLSNYDFEGYFEREADSPKLLETLKGQVKQGSVRSGARACKAGALPAELHAHANSMIINDCNAINMADDHLFAKQAVSQQGWALMHCRPYIPRVFGDLIAHYVFDFQSTRSTPASR